MGVDSFTPSHPPTSGSTLSTSGDVADASPPPPVPPPGAVRRRPRLQRDAPDHVGQRRRALAVDCQSNPCKKSARQLGLGLPANKLLPVNGAVPLGGRRPCQDLHEGPASLLPDRPRAVHRERHEEAPLVVRDDVALVEILLLPDRLCPMAGATLPRPPRAWGEGSRATRTPI